MVAAVFLYGNCRAAQVALRMAAFAMRGAAFFVPKKAGGTNLLSSLNSDCGIVLFLFGTEGS
jgi:hypothetical protein